MRLAVIISHPIQYYIPVFQLLAKNIVLKVFYTGQQKDFDRDFRCNVKWDIPLMEGYNFAFVSGGKPLTTISSFNPSHLLVYGWSPRGHVKILRHFKNKAHILFRGDSTLLKKQVLWKRTIKAPILRKIYTYVDTALYVGINNKAYFLRYGLKEHQLVFAPHAIDNKRFAQITASQSFRESLGISNADIHVLFAGKFTPNKNPLLLMEAFKCLALPNAHLLFVGSGELAEKLHQAARGNPNIHVWPFQNQQTIPMFYQACDLFCLPSRNESWGLAINEAMACGKAVLVSEQCGAAADLVCENNGSVFRSDDVDDLKLQLHYYLTNPSLLKKAGRYSRQRIKDWSFDVQVKNILEGLNNG